MKHLPWKLLASALTLGVLFDVLFYKTQSVGINVLLMQTAILLVSFGLAKYLKQPVSKGTWISAIFSLLFAATFAIWTSLIGTTLSAFGLITSNIFFAVFLLGHHGKVHHPFHAAVDGIRYIAETYITRLSIFGYFKIPVFSLRSSSVLRGILIALPIVIIFAALFLGSDLILQQRAEGFTTWLDEFINSGDVTAHIMIIAFFTFLFLIFFAGAFWKRLKFDELKTLTVKHNIESAIILISVNVLFFAFIIFQGVYLFGGQAAFNGIEGITYSEYAVNGFNELATVAVLVILLILSLRYFHTERSMRKLVHITELILIAETLAVVFSAWKRMALYVAQYDFTPARLFGFWFFILCAIILLLLAYHIVRKIPQYKFMQQAPIIIGIAMLLFTASAPDALAVKLNVKRGDIDPFPLFHDLSAEAYEIMDDVLNSGNYEFGLLDTSIEDYCPFVFSNYENNKIKSFTWTNVYLSTDDYPDADAMNKDYDLRFDLVRFKNDWAHIRMHNSWRTWNFSRSRVPEIEQQEQDNRNIQYTVEETAEACGLHVGDVFLPSSTPDLDDRRE